MRATAQILLVYTLALLIACEPFPHSLQRMRTPFFTAQSLHVSLNLHPLCMHGLHSTKIHVAYWKSSMTSITKSLCVAKCGHGAIAATVSWPHKTEYVQYHATAWPPSRAAAAEVFVLSISPSELACSCRRARGATRVHREFFRCAAQRHPSTLSLRAVATYEVS